MPVGKITVLRPEQSKKPAQELTSNITTWLGARIHRHFTPAHQLRKLVRHHLQNEITTISIQGAPGSGKTSLAGFLTHWIHDAAERAVRSNDYSEAIKAPLRRGYVAKHLYEDDLINWDETMKSLPPINRILTFDDLSFLKGRMSGKELEALKAKITKIRHLDDGLDVKTVLIMNYHYSRGLDKYLRSNRYIFFTSLGREERENVAALTGNGRLAKSKIAAFEAISNRMQDTSGITIKEPAPNKIRYGVYYRQDDPFRIAMMYGDGDDTPTFMAYPLREKLAPKGTCGVCHQTAGGLDPGRVLAMLGEFYNPAEIAHVIKTFHIQRRGPAVLSGNSARMYDILSRIQSMGLASVDSIVDRWLAQNPKAKFVGELGHPASNISPAFFDRFQVLFQKDIRRPHRDGAKDAGTKREKAETTSGAGI